MCSGSQRLQKKMAKHFFFPVKDAHFETNIVIMQKILLEDGVNNVNNVKTL